jgi:hypothetical protein
MDYPAGVKRKKEREDGEAHLGFEAIFNKERQNKGQAYEHTLYLAVLQLPFDKQQQQPYK